MAEILKLGQLIEGDNPGRDAVHVAIAPVIAVQTLKPGSHIGFRPTFKGDQEHVGDSDDPIGIVDPYLKANVKKGERFYLFLYPNTVTSLRHEWTHPAFGDKNLDKDKVFSEQWLRVYAAKMNCYDTPEKAYENLIHGLRSGKLFAHGSDLHGRYELDDESELQEHAERVLGIKVNFENFSFSCSC